MNIFTEKRRGTPITPEEREWIKQEIEKMKILRDDEEALEKSSQECRECGLDAFNRDVLILCIDTDIAGMERTLEDGKVFSW